VLDKARYLIISVFYKELMTKRNLTLIFIFILCVRSVFAQETNSFLNTSQIDMTHETVSKSLFTITNKIDSYFGDEKPLEEKNGSNIQLRYTTTSREFAEATTEPDFKINVKFRQLEKKLNFKFESIYDDDDKTTKSGQGADGLKKDRPEENALYRASIGFFKEQKRFWHISMDTGVKIQSPPNPFARMRGRRSFYFKEVELRLTDKVMLDEANGLYNYTDINVYLDLIGKFSFSYTNKFVWKNDLNELVTVHGPSVFQEITDKQAISYNIRTRFLNMPTYAITGHEIFSVYRRNIYKDWLFLELTPGVSLLADKNYSRIGFFTAQLEVNFGDF